MLHTAVWIQGAAGVKDDGSANSHVITPIWLGVLSGASGTPCTVRGGSVSIRPSLDPAQVSPTPWNLAHSTPSVPNLVRYAPLWKLNWSTACHYVRVPPPPPHTCPCVIPPYQVLSSALYTGIIRSLWGDFSSANISIRIVRTTTSCLIPLPVRDEGSGGSPVRGQGSNL